MSLGRDELQTVGQAELAAMRQDLDDERRRRAELEGQRTRDGAELDQLRQALAHERERRAELEGMWSMIEAVAGRLASQRDFDEFGDLKLRLFGDDCEFCDRVLALIKACTAITHS